MTKEVSQEIFDRFFSCFSKHSVEYKGAVYKTAEHAYHCRRYDIPEVIDEIMSAETPEDARNISQRYKSKQVAGFGEIKREVMKDILRQKLLQHSDVREALIRAGDDVIVKRAPDCIYWGIAPDGSGNEFGKIWMELRSEQDET